MVNFGLFSNVLKFNSSFVEDIIISDSLFRSSKMKLWTSLILGLYIALNLFFIGTFATESNTGIVFLWLKVSILAFLSSFIWFNLFGFIDNLYFFNIPRLIKYIILFVFNIFIISFVLFFAVRMSFLNYAINDKYLTFFYDVLIIMFLPGISFVLFVENYFIREKLKIIALIKSHPVEVPIQNKDLEIVIKSDNIKESLKINMLDFIYAKSDDNYSSIYYKNNGKISKALFRITLKKLEDQFKNFEFTIRCHKSYIINIDHIKEIDGASQNYRILMKEVDIQVPVSRNFPKSIIDSLKERNERD